MACNVLDFKLDAVSIEVLDVNLVVNVQDTFGELVDDALVSINCNGNIESGLTDDEGFFYAIVLPDVICTIDITKNCLDSYSGRFVLKSEIDLNDPESNFPVIVVDQSNVPVPGASVSIVSAAHDSSGVTNGAGLFQGINENDLVNTITISKTGYQTYSAEIKNFVKLTGELTGYHVVPVITLTSI
jgi:hypothetical protein